MPKRRKYTFHILKLYKRISIKIKYAISFKCNFLQKHLGMEIIMQQKKHFFKTKLLPVFSFVPMLLLLSIIFGFSAQDGDTSGSLSFQVSLWLVNHILPLISEECFEQDILEKAHALHYFVRKAAHMTEYFLLTLSVHLPLKVYLAKRIPFPKRMLFGFFITVLFAALDEFHQSFVPGRSGNFTDVCIDSIGILAATLLLLSIYFLFQHKQQNKKPAKMVL